jgi:hypothetical protein
MTIEMGVSCPPAPICTMQLADLSLGHARSAHFSKNSPNRSRRHLSNGSEGRVPFLRAHYVGDLVDIESGVPDLYYMHCVNANKFLSVQAVQATQ